MFFKHTRDEVGFALLIVIFFALLACLLINVDEALPKEEPTSWSSSLPPEGASVVAAWPSLETPGQLDYWPVIRAGDQYLYDREGPAVPVHLMPPSFWSYPPQGAR